MRRRACGGKGVARVQRRPITVTNTQRMPMPRATIARIRSARTHSGFVTGRPHPGQVAAAVEISA